eukprot:6489956-Amphidinium_carterae.1
MVLEINSVGTNESCNGDCLLFHEQHAKGRRLQENGSASRVSIVSRVIRHGSTQPSDQHFKHARFNRGETCEVAMTMFRW